MSDYTLKAQRIAARRERNPAREARRQAELTRMRRRILDYVPRYNDVYDRSGQIVRAFYIGHVARYAIAG